MENTPLTTEILRVDVPEQFIALFGLREENIPLFKEELGIEIFAHGGEISLTGEAAKVALARLTFEKLLEIIRRGDPVDRTRIRYAIELAGEGKADRIGEIMRDVISLVLKQENMNQTKAAKRLGISRSSIWRKLQE